RSWSFPRSGVRAGQSGVFVRGKVSGRVGVVKGFCCSAIRPSLATAERSLQLLHLPPERGHLVVGGRRLLRCGRDGRRRGRRLAAPAGEGGAAEEEAGQGVRGGEGDAGEGVVGGERLRPLLGLEVELERGGEEAPEELGQGVVPHADELEEEGDGQEAGGAPALQD